MERTTWSIEATPNPADSSSSSLGGVSCTSSTACTAVGYYYNYSSGAQVALAERWNGTSWSSQVTPNPTGAYGDLGGVSCTSSTACTAVGSYTDSSGVQVALAEAWNGTSWSIQATPIPTDTYGYLAGVSCTSSTACTAVGSYTNSSGATGTLTERWNGTSWSIQATPTTTGASSSYLYGVSCASRTACTAVGNHSNTSGDLSLAERWNGTSWSIQSTPTPTGPSAGGLGGVSCASSTVCTAVGDYFNSSGGVTLAERWNGTSWSVQATPTPTGGAQSSLGGVSCTSSVCTAVGSYTDSSGTVVTLAERWNGTSWSIQATPTPMGASSSSLVGVSCTSSTACTAVGNYVTNSSSGTGGTLAERWNGTSWSIEATPTPAGAFSSSLGGVSCTSSTACTAVGFYTHDSLVPVALAERWNGTSWSIQPTPTLTSAYESSLGGVSCTSSAACTAVGNYYNTSFGEYVTLAERWNGTTWSIQATPNPTGPSSSSLGGVSCTSSAACTAVGNYINSSGEVTLAEAWNGTSWSIQATPTLTGNYQSSLGGVSCTSSAACMAVGSQESISGPPLQLAERYS